MNGYEKFYDLGYQVFEQVLNKDEIKENLPYKVLHIEGCEADDIIATLTMQTQEFGLHESLLINIK